MRPLWMAVAALVGASTAGVAEPARRPNVLWICADDHARYVFEDAA